MKERTSGRIWEYHAFEVFSFFQTLLKNEEEVKTLPNGESVSIEELKEQLKAVLKRKRELGTVLKIKNAEIRKIRQEYKKVAQATKALREKIKEVRKNMESG